MDIQQMIDAILEAGNRERSRYHLTLGGLIDVLKVAPRGTKVRFDHGSGVGEAHSYRGYYSDLSFEGDSEPKSAAELLTRTQDALGSTFEGYKGGDFVMQRDTPLWNAPYGCCGLAIVGAEISGKLITLVTKNVDE